jgi:hypothetical protein
VPRPKGFEPYTNLFRVTFLGGYWFSPNFQQQMSAIIWTPTSAAADGWVTYFNSLRKDINRTNTGLLWYNVKKDGPIKHFNRAADICGHLNAAVPSIFCGISGFSIG